MAGVKLVPVHYRGATPALNDVMAGHINLMSVSVSLALPPPTPARSRCSASAARSGWPRSPTFRPSPRPDCRAYEATTWFGLFAPAGTPRDVVMKLNAEANKIFSDPAFEEKFMAPQMFEPLVMPPEEFETFIKAEIKKWSKVIQAAKIKIE